MFSFAFARCKKLLDLVAGSLLLGEKIVKSGTCGVICGMCGVFCCSGGCHGCSLSIIL